MSYLVMRKDVYPGAVEGLGNVALVMAILAKKQQEEREQASLVQSSPSGVVPVNSSATQSLTSVTATGARAPVSQLPPTNKTKTVLLVAGGLAAAAAAAWYMMS